MADQTIDVLMRVVGTAGPMPAESFTLFTGSIGTDTLRDGFTPGEFCELREFSFSAGIEGSLPKSKQDKSNGDGANTANKVNVAKKPESTLTFAERRERPQEGQSKHALNPDAKVFVDMQPVDFTRMMDSASTLLFKAMIECETLLEVSIAKRKAVGSTSSGECYLRLDFQKVLITKLEWKDSEHVMMESGSFIYRKVTIRYRPQKFDGALGNVVQSTWTMPDAKAVDKRMSG